MINMDEKVILRLKKLTNIENLIIAEDEMNEDVNGKEIKNSYLAYNKDETDNRMFGFVLKNNKIHDFRKIM